MNIWYVTLIRPNLLILKEYKPEIDIAELKGINPIALYNLYILFCPILFKYIGPYPT